MNILANNGKQSHLAVFGDLKRSRGAVDRESAQKVLLKRLEETNRRFQSRLAVPLSLSMGDEVQGLLTDPTDVIPLVSQLDAVGPLSFRFGLGWGRIETDWSERATEMDGPCFHAARAAIERGKGEDRWVTFAAAEPDEDMEIVVNGVWRLIQLIRDGWTDRQHTAVDHRRDQLTSRATADEMGLDKSTLSKMLKAAHYKTLLEAESAMSRLLTRYLKTTPAREDA